MKYLKSFERKNIEMYNFKKGDYVVIIRGGLNEVCKIISEGFLYFTIELSSGGTEYININPKYVCLIPATPEQIEQYELEINTNKYNI